METKGSVNLWIKTNTITIKPAKRRSLLISPLHRKCYRDQACGETINIDRVFRELKGSVILTIKSNTNTIKPAKRRSLLICQLYCKEYRDQACGETIGIDIGISRSQDAKFV